MCSAAPSPVGNCISGSAISSDEKLNAVTISHLSEIEMKSLVRSVVVLALTAGAATAGSAQQGGAQKLAYVNVRAVLEQTPGYAKAESVFTKEVEGYRTEVGKLQAALDSASAEFEQSSVLMSPTARTAKRKELEDQAKKLETRTNEVRERAAQRERELLDPIQTRVSQVIDGIRAEGNYAIIFDVSAQGSGIISADKALDLSAKVIQRLQAARQ
jgi:Skp family chaperone for outer membrane proteins